MPLLLGPGPRRRPCPALARELGALGPRFADAARGPAAQGLRLGPASGADPQHSRPRLWPRAGGRVASSYRACVPGQRQAGPTGALGEFGGGSRAFSTRPRTPSPPPPFPESQVRSAWKPAPSWCEECIQTSAVTPQGRPQESVRSPSSLLLLFLLCVFTWRESASGGGAERGRERVPKQALR